MFFDPDACISHNNNPDRILAPSLTEIVKYENERADKVLRQQGNPNFIKNKIDVIMKKRLTLDELK
jgi:hypothetical protein